MVSDNLHCSGSMVLFGKTKCLARLRLGSDSDHQTVINPCFCFVCITKVSVLYFLSVDHIGYHHIITINKILYDSGVFIKTMFLYHIFPVGFLGSCTFRSPII